MKILEQPDSTWSAILTCERCGTVVEVDQDDVKLGNYKTSGMFFNGSAVCEPRWYVECPNDREDIFVPADDIPVLLRDAVKERTNVERVRIGMQRIIVS
jgi:hypothetical protein